MSNRGLLLLLLATSLVSSCTGPPQVVAPGPTVPVPPPERSVSPCNAAIAQQQVSRWNSPAFTISDDSLTRWVAASGGRVMIGFKEPGACGGVDEQGRVLVSESTVAAGKAYLRSLGVTIAREDQFIPMVVAVIDPRQVVILRRHPLIDYVEPRIIFRDLAQDTTWNLR